LQWVLGADAASVLIFVLSRPHVRQLTSFGKLSEAKAEHAVGSFFIYIGPQSDDEKLYVSRY